MRTCAFIDASNLFYGGEKSLGWKIDYKKLLAYLKKKYLASKVFYFGGVKSHNFPFNYLKEETVPVVTLGKYLARIIAKEKDSLSEAKLILFARHLQRARFYCKLQEFCYLLYLKPVKRYEQEDGTLRRKANGDVEMTFRPMKEIKSFDRAIILSGDGDFLPVLRYIREIEKEKKRWSFLLVAQGRQKKSANLPEAIFVTLSICASY